MKWNKDLRRKQAGYWRCAVKAREVDRGRWDKLTSLEYAKRRLNDGFRRRTQSVVRAREKYEREHGPSPS